MNLHVLFVTQWFPPEPYLLPLDIAQSLQAAGCDVTVLTGIPNYPSGSVARGYRAWRGMRETIGGLPVIRSPLFPSHDLSGLNRAVNYLSFSAASAIRALAPSVKFDVSLVFSSPITAAVPAWLAHRVRGMPYVMMVQDLWPNVVYESGLLGRRDHPLLRRGLDASCLGIYRAASCCFAITPGMRRSLIDIGVPAHKVETFWNWGPAEGKANAVVSPSLREVIGVQDRDIVLAYAGNMGSTHVLDAWVTAITDREKSRPSDRPVHLVFLGDGVVRPELERTARSGGTTRVHFLGRVDDETFLAYRAGADATVVSLMPSPVFDTSMPSKIPDTLAHGGVIIGAVRGDAADLITEAGGIVTEGTSPAEIGRAIDELAALSDADLSERRQRGRRLYATRMSRAVGTRALIGALTRAVEDPPR